MKVAILGLTLCLASTPVIGQVAGYQRISSLDGGFAGPLADGDGFGTDVAPIDDLDGNGVVDLVVGAPFDDYAGIDYGAVWILFLDHSGSVIGQNKIRQNSPGFSGSRLGPDDHFGSRVVRIGDLNLDQIPDLAIAAPGDDDGGTDRGAFYTLFMTRTGTAMATQKVNGIAGAFAGEFGDGDGFGLSMESMGHLDGDVYGDLAVGAPGDDDGGTDRGAVYVVFMGPSGVPKSQVKISSTRGGFLGVLPDSAAFGSGVANLGDVDGDGFIDIAVGAPGDGEGGSVWILFLNADGSVKGQQKIGRSEGGEPFDFSTIGVAVAGPGDLDGDGVPDLVLGDPGLDDGVGGFWILFLNLDGTVRGSARADSASFGDEFGSGAAFPSSLRRLGDVNGDGAVDFAAGHPAGDYGGPDRGAAWVVFGSYEDVSAQQLLAPANGSLDQATNLSMQWKPLDGAISYRLQVATTADFAAPVKDVQGIAGTQRNVTGLTPLTTYYWRVQPASLQGFGGWSAVWTFTTGTYALSTPVLLSPAFGTQGVEASPTLTWTASAGASGYDLVVSNSPTLESPVISLTRLRNPSEAIGPLEPLLVYYWRVRATSNGGDSPWSEVSYFSTSSTSVGAESDTPFRFELAQNYPNPFNPSTVVGFELPEAGVVTVAITDVSGRTIARLTPGFLAAGIHEVTFQAEGLPSGVYWYTLVAGRHRATRKMVLLR